MRNRSSLNEDGGSVRIPSLAQQNLGSTGAHTGVWCCPLCLENAEDCHTFQCEPVFGARLKQASRLWIVLGSLRRGFDSPTWAGWAGWADAPEPFRTGLCVPNRPHPEPSRTVQNR